MEIYASNIGGIDETTKQLEPGVTVLKGRNATNRTSFLEAIMAGLGSTNVRLKGDADEGHVELSVGDETYTRTLTRENGRVSFGGEPYLDDSTIADLFGFLLETNEARSAIARGDDLHEIIMEPVDTGEIQAQIRQLESEKRDIDEEINAIESEYDRLPDLKQRLTEYRKEIAEKETKLEKKEQEIDELDRDMEETRQEKSELEETLSELRSARGELEDLQYDLETEQESLESLRSERDELQSERSEVEDVSDERITQIEDELDRLRRNRQTLESEVNTLQQVIQFNEEMLDGASADIAHALRGDGGQSTASSDVTDQLLEQQESVVCWTCGSEVDRSSIEETIERLQSLFSDKHSKIQEIESEIEELTSEKETLESQQRQAQKITRRLDDIDEEISSHEDTIEDIKQKIDDKSDEIETLEAEAEELEDENYSEILETHKEANQLEFELDRLRKKTEDLEDEISTIKTRTDDLQDLKSERDRVSQELTELRTKIDRLQQDAVNEFNTHMEEVLNILDYTNIERIWLERSEQEVREGRRTVSQSTFDLHIVRSDDDGVSYEDTVDHLSESERKVTGLIFALAGYLTHEVYEVMPVMLLDSLEAIDSDRIADLVEYFAQYADYLVVALLPEDAQSINDDYERVTDI